MSEKVAQPEIDLHAAEAFRNRELSWLAFARRVLALVESGDVPLLERIKFAGIMGMLHDEFFMKRMSGLKRQMVRKPDKRSLDGRTPEQEFEACRAEVLHQMRAIAVVLRDEIRPALAERSMPILDYDQLDGRQKAALREYFSRSVEPILTPLAVDAEHPFPFISNLGLNLAVLLPATGKGTDRFIRVKVPNNRPRWVPLPDGAGFAPLEQVIAANLDLMFPSTPPKEVYQFRVTRGADGEPPPVPDEDDNPQEPGSIVRLVSSELKARRFAGVVRLQIDHDMPKKRIKWLAKQLKIAPVDIYPADYFVGLCDLSRFKPQAAPDQVYPPHTPVTHPRLADLEPETSSAIFDEIRRGDILLHHPYQSFETSVLRFIESAAVDPAVLAIKLTIYRTSSDSPIVRALTEASRRGKQVAVLVEITARFDEAPNIAWGKYLENEGVHVSYGVERLKTHVKLALVVREEHNGIRRYLHAGTGNYHTGTARIYEDVGVLTCDAELCDDAAAVFNELTGGTGHDAYRRLLVAPIAMRDRFMELIAREAKHARAGRASGIYAKMNQLQDPDIIRALYEASRAEVPITLNVRGLCCLRPGIPGLSESIRVYGLVGRFLEHSRIYRFENDGDPEYLIGSADWMKRNLSNRVETIVPVLDPVVRRELDELIDTYEIDNSTVWDCRRDGVYERRRPGPGEERRAAQEIFIARHSGQGSASRDGND